MRIVIAGAGEVGSHLATLLNQDKHNIVLISDNEQSLKKACIHEDLLKMSGAPTSISFLREAGVEDCDLFVGVTPDESRNMTSCMLAKQLGAKKCVARVDSIEYMEAENQEFFRKLGIDSLIYPELLVANEINHLISRPWARQWWEMQCGKLLLFAVVMREDCELIDKPISEISSPEDPSTSLPSTQRGDHHSSWRNHHSFGRLGVCHDASRTHPVCTPYFRQRKHS